MSQRQKIDKFCRYYCDGVENVGDKSKTRRSISDCASFWAEYPIQVNLHKLIWKKLAKNRAVQIRLTKEDPKFIPVKTIGMHLKRRAENHSVGRTIAKLDLPKPQSESLDARCDYFEVKLGNDKSYLVFGKAYLDPITDAPLISFDIDNLNANHLVAEYAMANRLNQLGENGRRILVSGNICRQLKFRSSAFNVWPEILKWMVPLNLSDEEDDAVQATPRLLQRLLEGVEGDDKTEARTKRSIVVASDSRTRSMLSWLSEGPKASQESMLLAWRELANFFQKDGNPPSSDLPDEKWLVGLKDNQKLNRLFRYWHEKGWKPAKIRDEYNRLPSEIRKKFGKGALISLVDNRQGRGRVKDGIAADKILCPTGFTEPPFRR